MTELNPRRKAPSTAARPNLKQAAVFGLFFIISSPIASIESSRNKVFIAEFDGIITDHYIGGHAMPSIKVKDSKGVIYTVQGVDEKSWELIESGQHITKQNGSLEILTKKQVAKLSQHATISKE